MGAKVALGRQQYLELQNLRVPQVILQNSVGARHLHGTLNNASLAKEKIKLGRMNLKSYYILYYGITSYVFCVAKVGNEDRHTWIKGQTTIFVTDSYHIN